MRDEKRVLFVCRYNRLRSILAEGFFNKYNKNKNIKVKSAAPIKGRPLGTNVKKIAKKHKIKIKKHPDGLTSSLIAWQNITVIVADDVPKSLFKKNIKYGKKVIWYKIKDASSNDFDKVELVSKNVEKKMKKLARKLR